MRTVTAFLLAISFACGEERPAAPSGAVAPLPPASPLIGRWSNGKRTLEFIADGTIVDLHESEAKRSTRLPDGTFRTDTVPTFRCDMGTYHVDRDRVAFDLTQVSGSEHRKGTWNWTVDGTKLLLRDDDMVEPFDRADRDVDAGARPLLGLWRRVGSFTTADMGIRFTPGGLSIFIGKNATWTGGSAASVSWLCFFATYRVEGETLHEVRPSDPDRPRSRTFKLEGDRLSFGPTLVYERVRGTLPLHEGNLDFTAWKAQK